MSTHLYAQELTEHATKLANALIENAKVQGTIASIDSARSYIMPSAIVDDIIVQEGDTVLISENGNFLQKLYKKEVVKNSEVQIRVVQIYAGGLLVDHMGVMVNLEMVIETPLPRCEFKRKP